MFPWFAAAAAGYHLAVTAAFAFKHRIEVRFRDCDSLRHVNNAVYFTYFEQARLVMGETLGLRRVLEGVGLGLILAHTACDYKAQLVFGDEIDVLVGVEGIGRSSFTYRMEVRRVRDGAVVATSRSVQVVFDYAAQRTAPIPDTLRDKLEALVTGSSISA